MSRYPSNEEKRLNSLKLLELITENKKKSMEYSKFLDDKLKTKDLSNYTKITDTTDDLKTILQTTQQVENSNIDKYKAELFSKLSRLTDDKLIITEIYDKLINALSDTQIILTVEIFPKILSEAKTFFTSGIRVHTFLEFIYRLLVKYEDKYTTNPYRQDLVEFDNFGRPRSDEQDEQDEQGEQEDQGFEEEKEEQEEQEPKVEDLTNKYDMGEKAFESELNRLQRRIDKQDKYIEIYNGFKNSAQKRWKTKYDDAIKIKEDTQARRDKLREDYKGGSGIKKRIYKKKIIFGKGITTKNNEYVQINKFYVDMKALKNNILKLKYVKNRNIVPSVPITFGIHEDVKNILLGLCNDKFDKPLYDKLDDNNKNKIISFCNACHIDCGISIDKKNEIENQLNILYGEYTAGNTDVKFKLKKAIRNAMMLNKLSSKNGLMLLDEIE